MYQYRTPGVRFEWLDPPLLVTGRRTDIAGFVGIAARGPLHQATQVESWTQFTSTFGAHIPQGYLAYAVEGFFANGGRTCWVVRVADRAEAAEASLDLYDDRGSPVLRLTARTPGTWGEDVVVTVARTAPDRFSLTLQTSDGGIELWRNLTMAVDDDRYVVRLLGDDRAGSRLVEAVDLSAAERFPENTPSERGATLPGGVGRLAGGADGLATLRPEHLSGEGAPPDKVWGLAALALVDDVSIVAIPDLMAKPRLDVRRKPRPPHCDVAQEQPQPPPVHEGPAEFPPQFDDLQLSVLQTAIVRHCEQLQDRVAVLDPRISDQTPTDILGWRDGFQSSYAALYWPWLLHPDPLGLDGPLRPVPPSGHVAGVYARGDQRVGVHKPPANELVEGIGDVTALADDVAHGDLNQAGVNVIRTWNSRGIRVAGARTLSPEPPFRYVNVRRLLNMIEEAILDTQWAVFEPSGPDLWREVDRVVRGFLDRLWRRGMLDGTTAADAYSVTCDETTNTPEDVDAGRLVTQVGVQPPWPAEFVVVRIGRTETATQISETGGTSGG